MKTQPPNSFSRGSGGFTLIEVTLAMGVVAFAFVSLMGLIPIGMATSRSAIDTSVRSQIIQHVLTDAMETDFDTLISGTAPSTGSNYLYFDDQANVVPQQSSVYQVEVLVTGSTNLPSPISAAMNTNLAIIQIQIANNPGHVQNPFIGNTQVPVFETTTYAARNEYQ